MRHQARFLFYPFRPRTIRSMNEMVQMSLIRYFCACLIHSVQTRGKHRLFGKNIPNAFLYILLHVMLQNKSNRSPTKIDPNLFKQFFNKCKLQESTFFAPDNFIKVFWIILHKEGSSKFSLKLIIIIFKINILLI